MFCIRSYQPGDLEPCRALWAALVAHHRRLYREPAIGGEAPGLHFDGHLNVRPAARNAEAIRFFHEAGFRLLGRIELLMDLGPAPGGREPGPELGGCRFGL